MKTGIAGLGGIGSNAARLFAQAGMEELIIADFDYVELSNLNRQFYTFSQIGKKKTDSLEKNLKEIFPDIKIEKIDRKIRRGESKEIFSCCDIVIEGFDNKIMKKMIVEELSQTDIILISASGIAGSDMEKIKIRKMGNCYIVGDFRSDTKDFKIFPPKISMIVSIMAGIALRKCSLKTIS